MTMVFYDTKTLRIYTGMERVKLDTVHANLRFESWNERIKRWVEVITTMYADSGSERVKSCSLLAGLT